jgi:Undecaprenyl-phosphate glucose phosphotransferase
MASYPLAESMGQVSQALMPETGAGHRLASPVAAKPVWENVVTALVAALDGLCVLSTGTAMLTQVAGVAVDWQLAGLVVILGTVCALNLLRITGSYRFHNLKRMSGAMGPMLLGWGLTVAALMGTLWALRLVSPEMRHWFALWAISGLVLLSVNRTALHLLVGRWLASGRLCRVIAVVGAGPMGQRLLRQLNAHPDPQLRIIGVYDDRKSRLPGHCMGHPIVGTVDDLIKHVRDRRVDDIVVAMPLAADGRLARIMNKLHLVPVDVHLCPDQFGFQLGACRTSRVGGLTLLTAIQRPMNEWSWLAKAIEDRLLAAAILLLISPLMLAVAVLIKLETPGPVFFTQKRYGYNNRLIHVLKFRSMYHHARDENASRLTCRDDPRVTRIGAVLRRTSIDELPQFINVLRGEMSIVGPRPHALAAKAGGLLYQDAVLEYDARHRVKPGITGWAQINGWRGETETVTQIRKRVEHDLYYIENRSVLLDLKIIMRTILVGFTGHNAY